MPRPRSRIVSPGWVPAGTSTGHVAVERRHLDRRAERGQRGRDVDDGDQVLGVAQEALVLAHAHDDVEVAVGPAALAGVAAAGDAGSAGRRRSRAGRRPRPSGGAPPSRARRRCRTGDSAMRPSPPQVSQIAVRTSWPKRVRATRWVWPEPWQVGQATIGVPGSAPLPRQVSHSTVAS